MSTSLPLSVAVSVVLNASGNGTVSIGPQHVAEIWLPSTVAVSVTTNVIEAQGYLYVGLSAIPANLVGATSTASTGDSCDLPGMPIYVGTFILFSWLGGDVGKTATMSIFGTRQLGK
jgi:hypothetical protein